MCGYDTGRLMCCCDCMIHFSDISLLKTRCPAGQSSLLSCRQPTETEEAHLFAKACASLHQRKDPQLSAGRPKQACVYQVISHLFLQSSQNEADFNTLAELSTSDESCVVVCISILLSDCEGRHLQLTARFY